MAKYKTIRQQFDFVRNFTFVQNKWIADDTWVNLLDIFYPNNQITTTRLLHRAIAGADSGYDHIDNLKRVNTHDVYVGEINIKNPSVTRKNGLNLKIYQLIKISFNLYHQLSIYSCTKVKFLTKSNCCLIV